MLAAAASGRYAADGELAVCLVAGAAEGDVAGEEGAIGRLTGTSTARRTRGRRSWAARRISMTGCTTRNLNGAGALMDYCCYGSALARQMLGMPSRVTGVAGHVNKDYVTVDDNAVIVMQWPQAMAIAEGSWAQIGHLTAYVAVFFGSEGTIVVESGRRWACVAGERRESRTAWR